MRSRSCRCAAAFLFCGVQTGLEVGARCTRAGTVLPCLQREDRACRGRTLLVDGNYAAAQPSRAGCVRLVGADVLGRPPPATAPLTIDVRRGRGYNKCALDVAFKLT